jgi:hypothetical protein
MDGEEKVEDHLWDEYALIQDKIDKVGDFRFRVRSWAITLVSGLSFGSTAASLPASFLYVTLPVVLLFWLLEENQRELQQIYIGRALVIERALPSPRGTGGKRYRPQPRLGRWTIDGLVSLRKRRLYRLISYADQFFYGLLIAALLCIIVLSSLGAKKVARGSSVRTIRIEGCELYFGNPEVSDEKKGKEVAR